MGTPYGDLKTFREISSNEGTIFYLENSDFSPYALTRALWQMRLAGWFESSAGIMFGRNYGKDASDPKNLSYLEAIKNTLGDLNIPVVFDADIGHKPPNMTLINGALATVEISNGKATVLQKLI